MNYTIEDVECIFNNKMNIVKNDLFPIIEKEDDLSYTLPKFNSMFQKGTYIFVVPFSSTFKEEDLNCDRLRPWNKNNKKVKLETIWKGSNIYKYSRAQHPDIPHLFRKNLYNSERAVCAYTFQVDTNLTLKPNGKHQVEEPTAKFMTVSKTRNIDNGRVENNRLLSSLQPTPQLSSISLPKDNPNKSRLIPLHLILDINKLVSFMHPYGGLVNVSIDGQKQNIVASVIFQESLKLFGGDCPSQDVLMEFHESVRNGLENGSSNAQFVQGMESQITLVTTSDVSQFYTTLIMGNLAKFKTKKDRKEHCILLGVMLHSQSDRNAYQMLGKVFESCWAKTCGGKGIPSVMRDGDEALDEVFVGPQFEHTTKLSFDPSPEINGTEITGTEIKQEPIDSDEPQLPEWQALFNKQPPQQPTLLSSFVDFCSTTRSSNRYNGALKNYAAKKLPGDAVMQQLIKLHLDELQEINAAYEGRSKIIIYENQNVNDWADSNSDWLIGRLSYLPPAIFQNLSPEEKKAVYLEQSTLTCTKGPYGCFFVSQKDNDDVAKVTEQGNMLICCLKTCCANTGSILPCSHAMCVLRNVPELAHCWSVFENNAVNFDFEQKPDVEALMGLKRKSYENMENATKKRRKRQTGASDDSNNKSF